MKVILNNVRLAFPAIWEPKQMNGEGEPACSAALLMDPNTPEGKANIAKIEAAMKEVAKEKWKDKVGVVWKGIAAKGHLCLRDGSEKTEYAGFDGMMFVSSRNASRPVVIDRDKSPLTKGDGKPYGGCYVNVSLDVWAQDNKYGKRINAKLLAIQFWADGEAFSGGESYDEDDFAAAEGGDASDPFAD